MTRLRPFTFQAVRDGERSDVTFYAATRGSALRLAIAWARPRRWTIEGQK